MNTCLSLTCSASPKADEMIQTLPQFSLKTAFSKPRPVTKSHVCEYCDEDPNPLANVVVSHYPERFAAMRGQNQNTWHQKRNTSWWTGLLLGGTSECDFKIGIWHKSLIITIVSISLENVLYTYNQKMAKSKGNLKSSWKNIGESQSFVVKTSWSYFHQFF